jgi:hypothetical protein
MSGVLVGSVMFQTQASSFDAKVGEGYILIAAHDIGASRERHVTNIVSDEGAAHLACVVTLNVQ